MAAVASETFTSVSAPIQYAAVDAFTAHPDIERYLVDSRKILGALGVGLRRDYLAWAAGSPTRWRLLYLSGF